MGRGDQQTDPMARDGALVQRAVRQRRVLLQTADAQARHEL